MSTQTSAKPNGQEIARPWTAHRRAVWLKGALCGGMLAGLLLSYRLWLSERFYPLTPVWPGLPPIRAPWDVVVFGSLIVLLVGSVVARRPRPWMVGVIGVSVLLGTEDQSRWQPWFYQYLLMLGALTLFSWTRRGAVSDEERTARERAALGTCRFLVACVYLWSGVHKANWTFVHIIFPWMTGPVAHWLPHVPWAKMAVAVPLIEFATGLGLLTVRGRPWAILMAVATHVFILVCLGPWGLDWNSVVWPWNVAMILFVVLLFGRDRTPFWTPFLRDCVAVRRSVFPTLAALLFGVMPAFSFCDRWDAYLSVSLYSGDTRHASLTFSEREAKRLPTAVRRFGIDDGEGMTLDLSDWSTGELNVPPTPEMRIYRHVAQSLCAQATHPSEIALVVMGKPDRRTGTARQTTSPCSELRTSSSWPANPQ